MSDLLFLSALRRFACLLITIFWAGSSLAHGKEPARPKLLATRPAAPFIVVEQFLVKKGFMRWTPTLTLGEAVEAAGGFQGRNDLVRVERVAPNLVPNLCYSKNRFLQTPTAQGETFRPGDLVIIDFLLKPW